MSHDLFISYSSKDKPIADAICAGLEAKSIRCWIAPRDISPGSTYSKDIMHAIATVRIMVIVFSANSNRSVHVLREVERAVHNQVIIIPFRIEDVQPSESMEYFLSIPHWLDAITPPLEKHIQGLIEIVQRNLDTKGAKRTEVASDSTAKPDANTTFEEISPDDWTKPRKKSLWNTLWSIFEDKS